MKILPIVEENETITRKYETITRKYENITMRYENIMNSMNMMFIDLTMKNVSVGRAVGGIIPAMRDAADGGGSLAGCGTFMNVRFIPIRPRFPRSHILNLLKWFRWPQFHQRLLSRPPLYRWSPPRSNSGISVLLPRLITPMCNRARVDGNRYR